MPEGSASVAARHRKPGSQGALRQLNEARVVSALVAGGPTTQAQLARRTGLSTATVSNIVRMMSETGLVRTAPTTSSGRRAVSVTLNSRGAVSVGMDFGRRHVRVVLASLGYRVVAERAVALPLGHLAEESIEVGAALLDGVLAENAIDPTSVLGIGVGIPGPIDRRTGTVVTGAILPEWVGLNLLVELEKRLGFPVYLDNDANLGALAQVTWGPHGRVHDLVFVKIGSGIGSGLIIDGAPFYGFLGITGEIGHATITDHGLGCRCGNRGCLETVASTTVMTELLRRGSDPVSVEDVVRQALIGDAATLRVIDDAGMAVGRALANVANLINPEVIVIGGPLVEVGDLLLDPIRRGLSRYAVPVIGESTTVVMSSLGDRAEALGGAALVFQHVSLPRS